MTKQQAIAIFGTTQLDLALALGVSRGRIGQWGDTLKQEQIDRVIGAAVRLGKWPSCDCSAAGDSTNEPEAA
jgi:hypothetical protein